MSAFLGPIHHQVYNKLLFQHRLNNLVIETYLNDIKDDINAACGNFCVGQLEEIIDLDNIHTWLSNQVMINEKTQAFIMEKLNQQMIKDVENLYYMQGKKLAQEYPINGAKDLFMAIHRCFINGMPCDKGLIIDTQSDDMIIYTISEAAHPYGDFKTMMNFRTAFINGLNINDNIEFKVLDDHRYMIKEHK